jgi:hypothetical protein
VDHPAKRIRRTRSRRRLALLAVGLLGLVTARALATSDGFPARSQTLPGAPAKLLIQDGVGDADMRAVADGVRHADRFIRIALGAVVRGPVEVRIARGDPCPGEDGDRSVIGNGGAGGICIDTANLHWQWLSHNHRVEAAAIAAHEYVHVLQAQLGCLPAGDDRDFRWIVEGMASHIGWEALVSSGRARDADVRRAIRRDGAFDVANGPLRRYEREGGRTPQYAQWHLAVRGLLARPAARPGAAAHPDSALLRFCEQVGAGRPWRGAFLTAFGRSAFDFYARFEAQGRR